MNISVEMKVLVCQKCGFIYGVPQVLVPEAYTCPGCAGRTQAELRKELWASLKVLKQERLTIAALKGRMTRLKKKLQDK